MMMKSGFTAFTFVTLTSLFLFVQINRICGSPHFVVTSGKPKCFNVEVPKQTTIKIHYEAPDVDVDTESKKYSPTYMTLMENPIDTLEELRMEHETDDVHAAQRKKQLDWHQKNKPKAVSQEINEYSGFFLHHSHVEDSIVNVCIRASKANERSPMFFHVRVEELEEDELDEFEKEKSEGKHAPLLDVEHHWSFLETQLNRIEHEMRTIIREADFFRERDALYHQQTDDLHEATLFWPVLHCCILLLTGFTQANHIIHFFKSRRIV